MDRWSATSGRDGDTFRRAVLLRFSVASRVDPGRLRLLLEQCRQTLQSQCAELTARTDEPEAVATASARLGPLTALHELRTAPARLSRTDEASAAL
jgi:hypothetical protein